MVDETLVALMRWVRLPYYRSISSQQSLPIQVIRQQSACLREQWSRQQREGGNREEGEKKRIIRRWGWTDGSLSLPAGSWIFPTFQKSLTVVTKGVDLCYRQWVLQKR